MMNFASLTYSQKRFPDPQSLVNDLHINGFKAIWMLDPGIKCEKGYFVYDSGSECDVWIQKENGESFVGKVSWHIYLSLPLLILSKLKYIFFLHCQGRFGLGHVYFLILHKRKHDCGGQSWSRNLFPMALMAYGMI